MQSLHSTPWTHSLTHSLPVQIQVGAPENIVLRGGGLDEEYVFDQMHFHWGSEHTINGRRFALEVHLVHHDRRYSLREALQVKNGIAVLGVLFHVSKTENEQLQNILDSVDDIADEVGAEATIEKPLRAMDLLPRHLDNYFRYEGSLTTPGCMEAVVWTVFTQSMPLSLRQLKALKMVKDSNGTELGHNYRQVQPLNSRALIYVTSDDVEDSMGHFESQGNGGFANERSFFASISMVILSVFFFKVVKISV